VLDVIARINDEIGTTVIVITHNAAIAGMADRVVYLGDGTVQRDRDQRPQAEAFGAELVKALDRKLLRDLRLMWSQALTIALVVASGIGGFVTSLSAVDSLALARDRFYADGRFADVFVRVKRAPNALADALRTVRGVADVQTTLEQIVRVEILGLPDPIIGQLIGLDRRIPAG
jgi:energy-coupling factor transporter ATP-binding protein EcfA2